VLSGNTVLSGGEERLLVLGCFHPSQQNTFTGRVTADMVDAVLSRARTYAAERSAAAEPNVPIATKSHIGRPIA
jgi:hypothetical protein